MKNILTALLIILLYVGYFSVPVETIHPTGTSCDLLSN